jgi:hypothetical protein
VIVCTQLGENSKVSFALYPNPAKDVLFLQLSANVLSKIQVSVVDVSGKIILSKSLEKAQKDEAIAIDVKGLSAGTYFAQLKTGNQVQKVKFIKD